MDTADAATPRRWRGRARALAFALLAPWLLWLLVAHLCLLTPLGEWLLAPRSGRWRVSWSAGWSVHPGRIHLHGFAYRQGPADGPGWTVTADRVHGRVAWSRLARRELRVAGLRARGVEAVRRRPAERGRPAATPAAGASTRRRTRPPWRVRLADVELREVRRIDGGTLALAGRGTARGTLDVAVGQRVDAVLERARFTEARLALAGEPFATGLTLEARARLGPYPPREHRGLAALDFLAGELTATGRSLRRTPAPDHPPAGEPAGAPLLTRGAPLRGRLLFRAGRLEPGSELRLDLPAAAVPSADAASGRGVEAMQAPRLALRVSPTRTGTPAELVVRIEAEALEAGLARSTAPPGAVAPMVPTLTTGPIRLVARTPERRLSRLLARRSRLGQLTADASVARPRLRGVRLGPLLADLDAEVVRGRVDLAALLRRDLRLAGVEGEGIALALEPSDRASADTAERRPWSLAIEESMLRVRSVRLGELAAEGDGTLAAALALDPEGDLEVRRFALRLAGARLLDRNEVTARRIEVEVDAALRRTPLRAGAAQLLSALEARVALRGEMERLGFLDHVARARPWVRLDGTGRVDMALALSGGRLQPGSRLEVSEGALEAAGLGWVAVGRGEVSGGVDGETARLRVALRGLQARPEGETGPAPLRGQRLDVTVLSRDLDLTAAASTLRAELRLAGGEAPDLARFAPLLP